MNKYHVEMDISSTDLSVEKFIKNLIMAHDMENAEIDNKLLKGYCRISWTIYDGDIVVIEVESYKRILDALMGFNTKFKRLGDHLIILENKASFVVTNESGHTDIDWSITPIN
jgi:hypothetical protein